MTSCWRCPIAAKPASKSPKLRARCVLDRLHWHRAHGDGRRGGALVLHDKVPFLSQYLELLSPHYEQIEIVYYGFGHANKSYRDLPPRRDMQPTPYFVELGRLEMSAPNLPAGHEGFYLIARNKRDDASPGASPPDILDENGLLIVRSEIEPDNRTVLRKLAAGRYGEDGAALGVVARDADHAHVLCGGDKCCARLALRHAHRLLVNGQVLALTEGDAVQLGGGEENAVAQDCAAKRFQRPKHPHSGCWILNGKAGDECQPSRFLKTGVLLLRQVTAPRLTQ